MKFGFSTEGFNEKMKSVGMWGVTMKHQIRKTNMKEELNITPKFRRDCMLGERMLIDQARKVVESGFIKTQIDYEDLAKVFHLSEEQVTEALRCYYDLINGGWNYNGVFKNIDEYFACLVTSDDIADYHWKIVDRVLECTGQGYTMEMTEVTHLEQKECFYFCFVMTKLAGGDFFFGDGFIRIKEGYGGERFTQTIYDLSWFLAAKILDIVDELATPTAFFGDKGDWWKYNKYPMVPAYITKVMDVRKGMPGGVTTARDVEDLFDFGGCTEEPILDSVVERGNYLDVKLLEWAAKLKRQYGKYAVVDD